MDFNKFRTARSIDMDEETIGCANCHDPRTMELTITSFPLREALQRQGKDPQKLSRNELRSLVCAQCHVEYYFTDPGQGSNKKPVLPWDNGMDPEKIYAYYNSHGDTKTRGFEGKFLDWTHPVSKTPMIKVQHPEYEVWYNGPHGAAGVSCADCHMSFTRLDGKKKISSHQWRSPLKDVETACRQCHADKNADYFKQRVEYTQQKTFDQLLLAQELSVKAHEAVRLANEYAGEKNADYENLVILAKEQVRKGQFYWDYVSAENSVGFHNPTKILDTLILSREASQQAVSYAMQATNYGIAKGLEGDIKTLVPPIRQHSRKLQQSAGHLASHKWLSYLPKLPEAPQVWDADKWVGTGPEPKSLSINN
jgi:nitrite reductase (cytochrome c-552)